MTRRTEHNLDISAPQPQVGRMHVMGNYATSVATLMIAIAIGLGFLGPADLGSRIARGVGVVGLLLLALAQFLGTRKQNDGTES